MHIIQLTLRSLHSIELIAIIEILSLTIAFGTCEEAVLLDMPDPVIHPLMSGSRRPLPAVLYSHIAVKTFTFLFLKLIL